MAVRRADTSIVSISPRTVPDGVSARIRALRLELADLEAQQRDDLFHLLIEAFPQVISAAQVWAEPTLRAACLEAGLATVKHLGYWLRSWSGSKLARLDRDELGTFWKPEDGPDLHADAGLVVNDDV